MISLARLARLARSARIAVSAVSALALLALAFQILHRCTTPLGNSDVFWQVRAGELALASGRVPDIDPFSYTIHGDPWNNHEWAFELLAARLHHAFGWGAFRLLVLACWGGTALALAVGAARRAGLGPALLVLGLFHAFAGYKLKPVPQTLSMPLLLGALCWFRGPAMVRSRRRAGALVVYLLVWGNLTAEALTFLPFLLLDQICLRRSPRAPAERDRAVLLLLVLAALAPLVNPPWSSTIDYVVRGTAVNRLVNLEFTPLWDAAAAVTPVAKLAGRAVVLLYLVFAARALQRSRRRWATLRPLSVGLCAVAGAVLLERDLWLLALPAGQMLAALSRAARLRTAAAAAALGLVVSGLYTAEIGWSPAAAWASLRDRGYRTAHVDAAKIPVRCIESLAAEPPGTRLFTLRLWASYAIWRLPEARVFYDGRNLEYGIELYEAGTRVWTGAPGAARILDATHTDRVIARPDWNRLPGLEGTPWAPVFTDEGCAVFARGSAEGR